MIPAAWRAWYEAVFERGDRCAPPSGTALVVVTKQVLKATTSGRYVAITLLGDYEGEVQRVLAGPASLVVLTDKGVWVDKHRTYQPVTTVGLTPKMGRAVTVEHTAGEVPKLTCDGKPVPFGMQAQSVASIDGRVYLKNDDTIIEVLLMDVAGAVLASPRVAVNVLPQATMLFPGGCIQDALGSCYAHVFPESGKAVQLRLKELDGYKTIEAKYDHSPKGGVLMVVAAKRGKYTRFVVRVDEAGQHDVRRIEGITPTGLNFVVLDTGVCVCLNEDEKLELCSTRLGSTQTKVVEDPILGGDMRLSKRGGEVLFARGTLVYSMKLV